ncbi:MAG: cytochrome C [Desulfuromonas sp.]|nr:MAG: cytochrome C [Desulfuromonas sp.]
MPYLTRFALRLTFLALCCVVVSSAGAANLTFDHQTHNKVIPDEPCATCHLEDASESIPPLTTCQGCHDTSFVESVTIPIPPPHDPLWGLNHRSFAKSGDASCTSCHAQSDCLECHTSGAADEQGSFSNAMVNVHRSDFQVSHPLAARTDPQLCSSCHENDFCVDCHNAFAPADLALDSHRRGWSGLNVGAASHADFAETSCDSCHSDSVLPSHDWSARHGREARKNLATCQACHPEGDICLTCHGAVTGLKINPHPANWNKIQNNLRRASDGKTCRRCH